MKIKALRSLGIGHPPLTEGQEAEVSGDVGRKLVGCGLAVCLDPMPEIIHAVPDAVEFTTAPVVEDAPIIAEVVAAEVEVVAEPEPVSEEPATSEPTPHTPKTKFRR